MVKQASLTELTCTVYGVDECHTRMLLADLKGLVSLWSNPTYAKAIGWPYGIWNVGPFFVLFATLCKKYQHNSFPNWLLSVLPQPYAVHPWAS